MSQPEPHLYRQNDWFNTVFLIILETLLTFLIKNDRLSQQLSKALTSRQTIIEVRTQLPSHVFYATFNHQGVLLDAAPPEEGIIHGRVSATAADLLRAFLMARVHILEKIQIEASPDITHELRELMSTFNLNNIFMSWVRSWFQRQNNDVSQPRASKQQMRLLLAEVDVQQKNINLLQLGVREQRHHLLKARQRAQMAMWLGGTIIVVLLFIICMLWLQQR